MQRGKNMAITRSELRKARYDLLIELAFTPQEARAGRDWGATKFLKETGFRQVTRPDWAVMSSKRNRKRLFPNEIEAYAIRKNREVGADDFNNYGFIFAYKFYVENKTETEIRLEVNYDKNAETFVYRLIGPRG